jgi:hypothetical protein
MGHEVKWLIHLFLCLLFFLLFSVFSLLADMFDSGLEFRHELNHVGHGEFIHAEPPSVLEDKVGSDVFVTGVEGGGKELFFLSFDKEFKEILNYLGVIGFSGSFDRVFVHFVFFGEGDGLFVLAVLSEEVGGDSSEFEEVVVFGGFGEVVGVEVGEVFDGFSELFIVFSLEVHLIQRLINFLRVGLLHNLQERLNKLNDIKPPQHISTLHQINLVRQGLQQLIDQHRLFFQIEIN